MPSLERSEAGVREGARQQFAVGQRDSHVAIAPDDECRRLEAMHLRPERRREHPGEGRHRNGHRLPITPRVVVRDGGHKLGRNRLGAAQLTRPEAHLRVHPVRTPREPLVVAVGHEAEQAAAVHRGAGHHGRAGHSDVPVHAVRMFQQKRRRPVAPVAAVVTFLTLVDTHTHGRILEQQRV